MRVYPLCKVAFSVTYYVYDLLCISICLSTYVTWGNEVPVTTDLTAGVAKIRDAIAGLADGATTLPGERCRLHLH